MAYVSTAWVTKRGWALLNEAVRLGGFKRYTEAARAALLFAAAEIVWGRGLPLPGEVEVDEGHAGGFRPQLGRLREVALRLPSPAPLETVRRWVAERLYLPSVSAGAALEWALAAYVASLRAGRRAHAQTP
jgi:hypothetical protein